MTKFLSDFWDYVTGHGIWSKVAATLIATSIIAIIVGLWNAPPAWLAVKTVLQSAWSSTGAPAWSWVAEPIGVPRLVFGLVAAAALGAALIVRKRVKAAPSVRLPLVRSNGPVPAPAVPAPPLAAPAPAPARAPALFELPEPAKPTEKVLNALEEGVLARLYRLYPAPIELRVMCAPLGLGFPEMERLAERLQDLQLVTYVRGAYGPPILYLTKEGRDLCIDRNIGRTRG